MANGASIQGLENVVAAATSLADVDGTAGTLGYAAPLAGIAMAVVASLVWRRALLRYQGVGH